MDAVWIVISSILILLGIIGSVAPLLPGPPLAFAGLLLVQLRSDPPFSATFLVVWAAIVIIISVLDYFIPIYGTKKFGGSKYGIWGCTIGLLAGIWLGPFGIIIGPFLGSFIGEMLANKEAGRALKAALGSFLGFLFGTLLKLVACFVMAWYFVVALIS